AGARRYRQGVRVDTQKQRTIDASLLAVLANRLTDRQDVPFVERLVERGTAMPRRAERDALLGHRRRGDLRVIGGDKLGDVDQRQRVGWLTGQGTCLHCWRYTQGSTLIVIPAAMCPPSRHRLIPVLLNGETAFEDLQCRL